jgi:predicted RNA-binding protein with TRAM domain
MNESRTAPVKAGEQYEVHIDSVGGKGDGIARVKGFVLFVPNTKENDFVLVKVTKVLEKVGFAEVVKKLEKKDRPAPRRKKFETVSKESLERIPEKPMYDESIEDTDDFGEDLDEE